MRQKNDFKIVGNLAEEILRLRSDQNKISEVEKLEVQIDQIVYKLYNLTPAEIAIMRSNA